MTFESYDVTKKDIIFHQKCESQPDGSLLIRVSAVHTTGIPVSVRYKVDEDSTLQFVEH
jgi:hypothetical protein